MSQSLSWPTGGCDWILGLLAEGPRCLRAALVMLVAGARAQVVWGQAPACWWVDCVLSQQVAGLCWSWSWCLSPNGYSKGLGGLGLVVSHWSVELGLGGPGVGVSVCWTMGLGLCVLKLVPDCRWVRLVVGLELAGWWVGLGNRWSKGYCLFTSWTLQSLDARPWGF